MMLLFRYGGFTFGDVASIVTENRTIGVNDIVERLDFFSSLWEMFLIGINLNITTNSTYSGPSNISLADQLNQLLSGLNVRNSLKVWFNNRGWAALPAYTVFNKSAQLLIFCNSVA